MALAAGERIGPYEILALLGVGGMGEVYKARDTRLQRVIALKTLPAEKVADADRKRRFLVEAQAASRLNHPNIVTIHDISEENGVCFIAMEYVARTTLEQANTSGLPLKQQKQSPSTPKLDALTLQHPCAQRRLAAGLGFEGDHAKQAVGVVVRTGGKEELIGLAAIAAVAELDGPELVDDDRLAGGIAQGAEERAGAGIERVDAAVGNVVGDEQRVAERAKIGGSHRQTPGRMQRAGDAQEHVARGIKFVDEAGGGFVATEGHPEVAPDILNAVRSKAALDGRIGKRVDQFEVLVENVDGAVGAVVGGVQEVTRGAAGDGQAGVDGAETRAVRGDLRVSEIHDRVPAADGAVQSGEEEASAAGFDAVRDGKCRRGISESDVKDGAGGRALGGASGHRSGRNGND